MSIFWSQKSKGKVVNTPGPVFLFPGLSDEEARKKTLGNTSDQERDSSAHLPAKRAGTNFFRVRNHKISPTQSMGRAAWYS
jgi:hypothetical protein